jgi:hypothetical protein
MTESSQPGIHESTATTHNKPHKHILPRQAERIADNRQKILTILCIS